jgi:hypothetical protein
VFFWSSEVLQKVTNRNNLGAGTNESFPNHVAVMLFVVVVVDGGLGDGEKVENSLIPLSVSFC